MKNRVPPTRSPAVIRTVAKGNCMVFMVFSQEQADIVKGLCTLVLPLLSTLCKRKLVFRGFFLLFVLFGTSGLQAS